MNMLQRYVLFWDRREPAWSLALVRILVAAVLLSDLVLIVWLDLVVALWAPVDEGGIGPATYARPHAPFYRWLGASATNAYVLMMVAIASAATLGAGFWTRTSALVLVACSTQLHALSPGADRGIDALLRNALVLLMFSQAGETWSVDAYRRTGKFAPEATISAWPRYLLIAQLVLLYFAAGIYKQTTAWTSLGEYSALFLVMHKPHYVRFELPHELLAWAYPLLQAATLATLVFECGAILLPVLMWLRNRAGTSRMRELAGVLLAGWIATGIFFHVALGVLLELGIFPWGCLALYPALLRPHTSLALVDAVTLAVPVTGRRRCREHVVR